MYVSSYISTHSITTYTVDHITKLYLSAHTTNPTQEEYAVNLHMAYIRSSNLVLQHKSISLINTVAVKLHKTWKKDIYLFYSIMTTYLQASDKNMLFYTLAEKMMERAVTMGLVVDYERIH